MPTEIGISEVLYKPSAESEMRMTRRSSDMRMTGLKDFLRHNGGNVTMLFGLMLIPLLTAMGLAVDYGRLMTARSTAQMAADAAALYASGYAKELIRKSDGSDAKVAAAFAESKLRAEAMFRAQIARVTLDSSTVTVNLLPRQGQDITANVTYSLAVKATLGQIVNINTLSESGNATAGASLPTYADVYMALDVSQSMGLAATNAGAITLFNATKAAEGGGEGCVFGCHVKVSGSKTNKTYQQIAAENNVKMRVDILRDSVTKTISTAESDGAGASTYRIGLYTLSLASTSATSNYALTELSPLTGNFSTLRTAASLIDLGPNNSGGTGDSYLNEQIRDLSSKIRTPGDGSSQNKAKTYVIIVTDGVRDIRGSCLHGHCMATIDPAACKVLKDRGITVGVIYTTYLPILENPANPSSPIVKTYQDLVQPIAGNIAPKLKECASSQGSPWFSEASDGPAIDTALKEMFFQTTKQAALKS